MLSALILTVAAWGVGLVLDANIGSNPPGFLCLRVLFPVLVMGLCILSKLKKGAQSEKAPDEKGAQDE